VLSTLASGEQEAASEGVQTIFNALLGSSANHQAEISTLLYFINLTPIHDLITQGNENAADSLLFLENAENASSADSREKAHNEATQFLSNNHPEWPLPKKTTESTATIVPQTTKSQQLTSEKTTPTSSSSSITSFLSSVSPFSRNEKSKKTTSAPLTPNQKFITQVTAFDKTVTVKKPTSLFGDPSANEMQGYYQGLATAVTTAIPHLTTLHNKANQADDQVKHAQKTLEDIRKKIVEEAKDTLAEIVSHIGKELTAKSPYDFDAVRFVADRLVFLKAAVADNSPVLPSGEVPGHSLPPQTDSETPFTSEQKTYKYVSMRIATLLTVSDKLQGSLRYSPNRPSSYELDETIFLTKEETSHYFAHADIDISKLYLETMQLKTQLLDPSNTVSKKQLLQAIHQKLTTLLYTKDKADGKLTGRIREENLIPRAARDLQGKLHLSYEEVAFFQKSNANTQSKQLRELLLFINLPAQQAKAWLPEELWLEQEVAHEEYYKNENPFPEFKRTRLTPVNNEDATTPVYTASPIDSELLADRIAAATEFFGYAGSFMKALRTIMDTAYKKEKNVDLTEGSDALTVLNGLLEEQQNIMNLLYLDDFPIPEVLEYANTVCSFISQASVYLLLKSIEFTFSDNTESMIYVAPTDQEAFDRTSPEDKAEKEIEIQTEDGKTITQTQYVVLGSAEATNHLLQHNPELIVPTEEERQEQEKQEHQKQQFLQQQAKEKKDQLLKTLGTDVGEINDHLAMIRVALSDLPKNELPKDPSTILRAALQEQGEGTLEAFSDAILDITKLDAKKGGAALDTLIRETQQVKIALVPLQKQTEHYRQGRDRAQAKKEVGLRTDLETVVKTINKILTSIAQLQNDLETKPDAPEMDSFRNLIGSRSERTFTLGEPVQTAKEFQDDGKGLSNMLSAANNLKSELVIHQKAAASDRKERNKEKQQRKKNKKQQKKKEPALPETKEKQPLAVEKEVLAVLPTQQPQQQQQLPAVRSAAPNPNRLSGGSPSMFKLRPSTSPSTTTTPVKRGPDAFLGPRGT